MFKVNDTIIYGSEGVCQIMGIEEKNFGGAVKSYYIVKPLYSNSSTIFIPLDSEILTAKMHRMLSREEIEELIDSLPNETIEWIPNDRERKNAYEAKTTPSCAEKCNGCGANKLGGKNRWCK